MLPLTLTNAAVPVSESGEIANESQITEEATSKPLSQNELASQERHGAHGTETVHSCAEVVSSVTWKCLGPMQDTDLSETLCNKVLIT